MSFRRARVRQLKRALVDMGVVRDAVVVKILTFTGLPMPKIVRPPTGRLTPDSKPQPVKRADEEAKPKRLAFRTYIVNGRAHVVHHTDPMYDASPGQRVKAVAQKRGPIRYPDRRL